MEQHETYTAPCQLWHGPYIFVCGDTTDIILYSGFFLMNWVLVELIYVRIESWIKLQLPLM